MMECYQKQQEEKYGCVFCPGLNFSSELTLLDHISIVHEERPMNGPLSGPKNGPMVGPSWIGPINIPGWSGPMSGPSLGGPKSGPGCSGPMNDPISGPGWSGPMNGPMSGPDWSGPMNGPMSSPGGSGPMSGLGWSGPMSGPSWSGPMSSPGWNGPMSGLRNGPKNYECSLCGGAKKFNSKNILIQHMVKAHEGKLRKKQSCFRCGEIYGERSVIEKVKHIIGKKFCSF